MILRLLTFVTKFSRKHFKGKEVKVHIFFCNGLGNKELYRNTL